MIGQQVTEGLLWIKSRPPWGGYLGAKKWNVEVNVWKAEARRRKGKLTALRWEWDGRVCKKGRVARMRGK